MCCFFNNNYSSCCRNALSGRCGCSSACNQAVFQTYPIVRQITPVNPALPVVTPAITAIGTAGTYANLAVVPLTAGASTTNSGLTVSNNALNLPVGTYQISYGASGNQTATDASTFAVQLYANGTPISGETVSANGTSTLPANVSRTIVYTANVPTALSLYNVSGGEATVSSAYITAIKLA